LVVDSHGVCHIIDTRRNDKIAGGINSFECAVDKLGGTKARTGTSCAAQTGSVAPAGNAVPAGTEVPVASAKPTGTMAPAGNAATVGAGTAGATVVGGYAPPVGSAGPAREGDEQSTPRADSSPKAPISLRLSGTPVQLAKGQANSSSSFDFANHENNDIFISASKATLGFKETNSDQVTNNITGTLGVPLQMKDRFNFTDVAAIPYVFIDREAKITNTYETSKSGTYVLNSLGRKIPLTTYSFTTNMVSTGAMLTGSLDKTKSFFNDLCQNCIENEVWSLRADYLFDYINQVDLLTTSLYYAPVSKSIIPINYLLDVFSSSSQVKFTFLLDARIKAGWYENAVPGGPATQQVTTTGLDVRVAQDYFRPGGQVGAAIELRCLLPGLCFPDYPIDLAVSYTDFYGLTGFHKSLGFFQTSASVSFGNNVSVIATYANGRRDDNTQQWEAWGINIGLGF
jgi:hypothetical protein